MYISPQTILPNINKIRKAFSEELRSQDCDDGRQSPITPTIYVKPNGG